MIQIKKKFLIFLCFLLLLLNPTVVKGEEIGNFTDVVSQKSIIEEPFIIEKEIISDQYAVVINSMSAYDKELICRIAYLESGNQCIEGQRAVIEVILNRLIGPKWPNTVEGVLSAPRQFSTWRHRNKVSAEQINQMNNVLNLVSCSDTTILPDNNYVYFNCKSKKNSIKIQSQWFWK